MLNTTLSLFIGSGSFSTVAFSFLGIDAEKAGSRVHPGLVIASYKEQGLESIYKGVNIMVNLGILFGEEGK